MHSMWKRTRKRFTRRFRWRKVRILPSDDPGKIDTLRRHNDKPRSDNATPTSPTAQPASETIPPAALSPTAEPAAIIQNSNVVIGAGSYWEAAVEKLKREKPEMSDLLKEYTRGLSLYAEQLASEMLDTVKKQATTMQNQQWKLPFKIRNKVIIIQNQINIVAKSLLAFKDCANVLVRLDPHHIAPMVWGGVAIILQTVLNYSDAMETAMNGVASISPIIAWYTRFESVYILDSPEPPDHSLKDALIEVYASILEYQISIAAYLRKSSFVRFLRAFPDLDNFASSFEKVRKKDDICQRYIPLLDSKDAKFRHDELLKLLGENNRQLENILSSINRKENLEILQWISNSSPGETHDNILIKAKMGTAYAQSGAWFRRHPSYIQWINIGQWYVETPSFVQAEGRANWEHSFLAYTQSICLKPGPQCLWLCGLVGRGKTALSARVIEWQLETASTRQDERVVFFYCSKTLGDDSGAEGTSCGSVLRSLVKQLAWTPGGQDIATCVKETYNAAKNEGRGGDYLSPDRCISLLKLLITPFRNVTIIVDALDECVDSKALLRYLDQLCQGRIGQIRLFFSSREDTAVSTIFKSCPKVVIRSEDSFSDLRNFIENEVLGHPTDDRLLQGEYPEVEREVIETLCHLAQGMFRWAELQLAICLYQKPRFRLIQDVRSRLQMLKHEVGLPSLSKAYEEIYELNTRPGLQDRKHAVKAYQVMLSCRKPFGIQDLMAAVSLNQDGSSDKNVNADYILDITRNLLFLNQSTKTVHFVHLSAIEYLENRKAGDIVEFSSVESNAVMADLCLTLLGLNSSEPRNLNSVLVPYAATWWPSHCKLAESCFQTNEHLVSMFFGFLDPVSQNFGFGRWYQSLREKHKGTIRFLLTEDERRLLDSPKTPSAVFIASIWGMENVLAKALDRGLVDSELNKTNRNGNTVLHVAAKYGEKPTMESLISMGAQKFLDTGNEKSETPLHLAVKFRRDQVVQYLLMLGASKESQNKSGQTALHLAVRSSEVKIVKILLRDIITTGTRENSSHLVLPYKASLASFVNIQDGVGNTALHTAISQYGEWNKNLTAEIISILLANGADIESKNSEGMTPLLLAAARGFKEPARLLIEKGAQIRAVDSRDRTAVHLAVWGMYMGSGDTLPLLLEKGVPLDERDGDGETPLVKATAFGYKHAVLFLLNAGAKTDIRGPAGGTLLHLAAASHSGDRIVPLLIQAGVDLDAKNNNGESAAQVATVYGHHETASLLKQNETLRSGSEFTPEPSGVDQGPLRRAPPVPRISTWREPESEGSYQEHGDDELKDDMDSDNVVVLPLFEPEYSMSPW